MKNFPTLNLRNYQQEEMASWYGTGSWVRVSGYANLPFPHQLYQLGLQDGKPFEDVVEAAGKARLSGLQASKDGAIMIINTGNTS